MSADSRMPCNARLSPAPVLAPDNAKPAPAGIRRELARTKPAGESIKVRVDQSEVTELRGDAGAVFQSECN
jgi:hypothetical protein